MARKVSTGVRTVAGSASISRTAKGPKYRYIYGRARAAVAEKLTKANRNGGLVFDAGTVTLSEYLDRWLNNSVRDAVRQRTAEDL